MINITVLKNVFIDISIPSFKLNRVITKLTNIIVTSILLLLFYDLFYRIHWGFRFSANALYYFIHWQPYYSEFKTIIGIINMLIVY